MPALLVLPGSQWSGYQLHQETIGAGPTRILLEMEATLLYRIPLELVPAIRGLHWSSILVERVVQGLLS